MDREANNPKLVWRCKHCGNMHPHSAAEEYCPSCRRPEWAVLVEEPTSDSDGRFSCDGKLQNLCREIALWARSNGFHTSWDNVPEKLMLIVTELSEAMEAYRKLDPANRDKWIVENIDEELADTAVRLFALAFELGFDLEKSVERKMMVNVQRPYRHGKNC